MARRRFSRNFILKKPRDLYKDFGISLAKVKRNKIFGFVGVPPGTADYYHHPQIRKSSPYI